MENSYRDENNRLPYLLPEKPEKVKKLQLELDMQQLTGSKKGKEYIKTILLKKKKKDCILSPCLLNLLTEYIMLGWIHLKLKSRLLGEI